MTTLYFLLQEAGAAQPGGSSLSMWIMLALIFLVMWLFMIRPQRKIQKELEKFREGLKKGDKVITTGGIYGTVSEVTPTTVIINIDKDVKIKVAKSGVQADPEAAPKKEEAPKA